MNTNHLMKTVLFLLVVSASTTHAQQLFELLDENSNALARLLVDEIPFESKASIVRLALVDPEQPGLDFTLSPEALEGLSGVVAEDTLGLGGPAILSVDVDNSSRNISWLETNGTAELGLYFNTAPAQDEIQLWAPIFPTPTWSGHWTAVVPEPSSRMLMLLLTTTIAAASRRHAIVSPTPVEDFEDDLYG